MTKRITFYFKTCLNFILNPSSSALLPSTLFKLTSAREVNLSEVSNRAKPNHAGQRIVFVFYKLKPSLFFLLYSLFFCTNSFAQTTIIVTGKAVDASNTKIGLPNVMVANVRTQQGSFTEADGTFTLHIQQTDTLVFRAFGYHLRKVCFADSTPKGNYAISVMLFRETYQLKEVTIMESRPADSVIKDIQKLGYNKNDFRMPRSVAYMSPISALYEEFSKKERNKRKVAEMVNNDKRKVLLHELLFFYYRNSVINLNPAEFDDFIDYNNFNDDLLKSLSAYDLAVYLKSKIAVYESRR